jgi:catechol 2,3-dioxygenase-like lactoylglutathione lyase family enzyme
VDFYQGLFGMPVISRQGPIVNLQIGTGPQFLSIAPAGAAKPSISQLGLAVEDFSSERATTVLGQHGVTAADASAGPTLGGPLRMRAQKRGPEAGGAKDGTPEFFFTDPDAILVQLQDPRYNGGGGPLGSVATPTPSPKKGVLALRGWSHCTIFGSDGARSNKFYQDVFGLKVQAYQGTPPTGPVMGVGGVEFLMFAGGGGGRGRGGPAGPGGAPAAPAGRIDHLCWNMDGFKTDTVIAALESYGIKPRGAAGGGGAGPLVHYITMRMPNRGGAPEGTAELYFTDPDGLSMQLQDTTYCGGAGLLGEICKV